MDNYRLDMYKCRGHARDTGYGIGGNIHWILMRHWMNDQDRIPCTFGQKRQRKCRKVDDESYDEHTTNAPPPQPFDDRRRSFHRSETEKPRADIHFHTPSSSKHKNKRDRSREYQETHRRKLENYVCQLEAQVVTYQEMNAALTRRSKDVENRIAKVRSCRSQHHLWLISRLHGLFYQGLSNHPQSILAEKQRAFCNTHIHANYKLMGNIKLDHDGGKVQAFCRDTLERQGVLYQDIFPSLMWETKTLSIDGENQELVSCTVEISLQLSHRVIAQIFPRCPVHLEGEILVVSAQVLHQISKNLIESTSVEMNMLEAWLYLVKGNARLAKDICDSAHMLSNCILLSDR